MTDELSYFDASALSKLVLRDEEGSDLAVSMWHQADRMLSSRLAYPETFSSIVKAHRNGRLNSRDLDPALDQFERYWHDVAVVELTPELARQASDIVRRYALSGADAVHVASAVAAGAGRHITFVTWDQRQAEAAIAMGLSIIPALG